MIYVGDAGKKHLLYDVEYLNRLASRLTRMEDAGRGDPLRRAQLADPHRGRHVSRTGERAAHNQLKDLFAGSTTGLVFVTTFSIAWRCESICLSSLGRRKSGSPMHQSISSTLTASASSARTRPLSRSSNEAAASEAAIPPQV